VQRIWLVVMVIVGLTTLVFELVYRHEVHAHDVWHTMPLFDLIYGFVGAIVLVWVSKWLGHTWLQREETYYGDEQL
jgi:multisubunit Na+/H+ antiporter MnhB subunit